MIKTEPVAPDSPLHQSVELGLQAAALLLWVLCSPFHIEDNWASRLWLHAACYDRSMEVLVPLVSKLSSMLPHNHFLCTTEPFNHSITLGKGERGGMR